MTLQQLENKVKILEGRLCCGKPMFYPTFVDFPATGKDNTLYVDEETGAIYIWNGTEYIKAIVPFTIYSLNSSNICTIYFIFTFYDLTKIQFLCYLLVSSLYMLLYLTLLYI